MEKCYNILFKHGWSWLGGSFQLSQIEIAVFFNAFVPNLHQHNQIHYSKCKSAFAQFFRGSIKLNLFQWNYDTCHLYFARKVQILFQPMSVSSHFLNFSPLGQPLFCLQRPRDKTKPFDVVLCGIPKSAFICSNYLSIPDSLCQIYKGPL